MYLTKDSLLKYVWVHHNKFWTGADVRHLIQSGKLKVRSLGNKKVFREADVEAYMQNSST